ncbi:MAG: hypothetical protein IPN40_02740 [Uliginosibacterium sp.]|nr:hypothetical protein [Uliginosibacterium sp.]
MTCACAPRRHIQLDLQLIAARDASWRMQDQQLADRIAFRVKRLLHAQRALVQIVAEQAATRALLDAEIQRGSPALRVMVILQVAGFGNCVHAGYVAGVGWVSEA